MYCNSEIIIYFDRAERQLIAYSVLTHESEIVLEHLHSEMFIPLDKRCVAFLEMLIQGLMWLRLM